MLAIAVHSGGELIDKSRIEGVDDGRHRSARWKRITSGDQREGVIHGEGVEPVLAASLVAIVMQPRVEGRLGTDDPVDAQHLEMMRLLQLALKHRIERIARVDR